MQAFAPRNLLYAQSGGVTAVINASAAAVIRAARDARSAGGQVGKVYAAADGILGVLAETLFDTDTLDDVALAHLAAAPGGAFGACRFDLDRPEDNPAQYDRVFEVFAAHGIGYFLYNGGNGSMDTVVKLSRAASARGYPLVCVGVPKTIDNDLVGTDCCPGFGSAAKYLACAMREAGLDVASMASPTGRIFVVETMGRNVGWLAASTALGKYQDDDPPHLILLPEVPWDEAAVAARVDACVRKLGFCAITVAEGLRDAQGRLIAEIAHDNAGHVQLGGAGRWVAQRLASLLGVKQHVAVPDYLQRAAGHLRSATDLAQAEAAGRAAVEQALAGQTATMPAVRREADEPYRWSVFAAPLEPIANQERAFPEEFLSADRMQLSEAGIRYLRPLIAGEVAPAYVDGLPDYRVPRLVPVARKLASYPG